MRRLMLVICMLALPCLTEAADTELLSRLKMEAGQINPISSEFTQEKHLAMFDEVLVSKGYFAFARPTSLRWEYTAPFKAGFLLKDDSGKEWDEASGTERDFTLDESPAMSTIARQIMAWTTFDTAWLENHYTIRQTGQNPIVLELKPKGEVARKFVAHLIITFAASCATLSSLELHEVDGDFTRITFTSPQINGELSPETFTSVR